MSGLLHQTLNISVVLFKTEYDLDFYALLKSENIYVIVIVMFHNQTL